MTVSAVLAAALLQPPSAEAPELPIPSRIETTVEAECRGRPIKLRYTVDRPGPDQFSVMSVGAVPLPPREIARLNQMLGGYMLDQVALYSCEGEGDAYEVRMHLHFSKGEERHIYLMGMRSGRFRIIR